MVREKIMWKKSMNPLEKNSCIKKKLSYENTNTLMSKHKKDVLYMQCLKTIHMNFL